MIDCDPNHPTSNSARAFDLLTAMLVAALIGVAFMIFGR